MPVIQNIRQNARLQVSSPVQIRSSNAARLEGENIASFGSNLQKAVLEVRDFEKRAKETSDKIKLAQLKETAVKQSQDAYQNVHKDGSADGSDYLAVYTENYDKVMYNALNSFEDGDARAQAKVIIDGVGNQMRSSVVNDSMKANVQDLAVKGKQAFGQTVSNVYTNPYSVTEAIARNDQRLDAYSELYSASDIQKMKVKEAREISLSSVNGLVAQGKYKDAKKMVLNELSGSFGAEIPDQLARIDNAKQKAQSEALTDEYKTETQSKRSASQLSATNKGKFFGQLLKSAGRDDRAIVKDEMKVAVMNGQMSLSDYTATVSAYEKTNPMASAFDGGIGTEANAARIEYIERIIDGEDDVVDDINDDVKSGIFTLEQGEALLGYRSSRIGSLQNPDQNPGFPKAEKMAVDALKRNVGANFGPDGTLSIPKSSEADYVTVSSMYQRYVTQGLSPDKASTKALKEFNTQIKKEVYVAPQFLDLSTQESVKQMQEARPAFNKKLLGLQATGKEEDAKKGIEALTAYRKRLKALQYIEGIRE